MIHQQNDRIAAPATPLGTAALAVIRTSGEDCVHTLAALTDRPESIRRSPGGRLRRAMLVDPDSGRALDDVMLGVYRSPRSYTGEESVEIYCHGSIPGVQEILALLYRKGFRAAEPGEFTMRAFLAGKIDLTRAEAVQEIVRSRTARGHEMALHRLGGSVEEAINAVKTDLVNVMARVAVQLDYPEEETGEIPLPPDQILAARKALEQLAGSYRTGRLYQEGVRLALAGRTNAGKSSLFNAFLKEDRAIVSATHGTTRDYIESAIDLDGVPVTLYDTAGLRRTLEEIEGEGIRRTTQVLEAADLVLYLVDGTEGLSGEDTDILESLGWVRDRAVDRTEPPVPDRLVPVWNKTDDPRCKHAPAGFLPVSAVSLHGINTLVQTILARVTPETRVAESTPVIDSLRQRDLLNRAVTALEEVERGLTRNVPIDAIALDLQEAIHALGEITGEVSSADILDAVFNGFCVGK